MSIDQNLMLAKADNETRRSQRAVLALLSVITVIASTGLAAGGTAGSLLGERLAGTDALAGLPLGMLVIGSGIMALVISRQTSHMGWGRSLMLGYVVGAFGGTLVIVATVAGSFAGLLAGSLMLGAANSSVFLTRYAAAAISGEGERGRALGAIFFATAIGAVASPGFLGPSGALARMIGLPPLSGLYLIAMACFITAALLFAAISHAAVPYVGFGAALLGAAKTAPVTRSEIVSGLSATPAKLALVILAATNLVMVAIMAIAPVQMTAQNHDLQLVGVIVSMHVAGMFAPSPVTGWLADHIGATKVAVAGLLLLIAAGITGALMGQHGAMAMGVMLILLGAGWNCGVVGGSILLASSATVSLRVHVEGIGEVAMSFAAALGAPTAGVVVALGGISALALAGAFVALFTLAFVVRAARQGQAINSYGEGEPCPSCPKVR
jgi:predicted MFS family arabinose efflux permease